MLLGEYLIAIAVILRDRRDAAVRWETACQYTGTGETFIATNRR